MDIKDFIGVYDGYISENDCIEAIDLFKHHESFNKVYSRLDEGFSQDEKSDSSLIKHQIILPNWSLLLINLNL